MVNSLAQPDFSRKLAAQIETMRSLEHDQKELQQCLTLESGYCLARADFERRQNAAPKSAPRASACAGADEQIPTRATLRTEWTEPDFRI